MDQLGAEQGRRPLAENMRGVNPDAVDLEIYAEPVRLTPGECGGVFA